MGPAQLAIWVVERVLDPELRARLESHQIGLRLSDLKHITKTLPSLSLIICKLGVDLYLQSCCENKDHECKSSWKMVKCPIKVHHCYLLSTDSISSNGPGTMRNSEDFFIVCPDIHFLLTSFPSILEAPCPSHIELFSFSHITCSIYAFTCFNRPAYNTFPLELLCILHRPFPTLLGRVKFSSSGFPYTVFTSLL